MTGKKIFAALIFLSTIIGVIYFNSFRTQTVSAAPISCISPSSAAESAICIDMETQILAATVRIELLTWGTSNGQQKQLMTESHATILDGKYLVTHNHFKYSLIEQVEIFGEQDGYAAISLRATNGNLIIEFKPLNSFSIVYQDAEILVLAFGNEDGRGIFETAGLPSAEFAEMDSISLEEGDELAQIDWDGEMAHVDWVQVDKVIQSDTVPQIQVNSFPLKGSSGGGVFLNGIHVGINWMRNTKMNQATGEITGQYSTVALNSSSVVELSH